MKTINFKPLCFNLYVDARQIWKNRTGGRKLNVKVKFFASYKEAIGIEQVDIRLEDGADVSSLIEVIKEKHPKLGDLTETLVISVNWEYASYDTKLKDGDEVALLPPVSGG